MTARQASGYIGAVALLDKMPEAQWLLGDHGYGAAWSGKGLGERGTC